MNWGKYWPYMTSYGLDEWFWAMFKLTWTLPNFTFGQLFMWIGANNDQLWLPMDWMSDSEQCSNRLEFGLISLLVNLSCELGQIMIRYDFMWARWVILSNVRTDCFQIVYRGEVPEPTYKKLSMTKSSKCNISISNGPIAFKFYTEVKYLKLHTKNCQ